MTDVRTCLQEVLKHRMERDVVLPLNFSGTKPFKCVLQHLTSKESKKIKENSGDVESYKTKLVVLLWKPISFIFCLFQLDCTSLMIHIWCFPKSGFGFDLLVTKMP